MKPHYHHTHPRTVTHDGVRLRFREATRAEQKEYDDIRSELAQRAIDAAKAKAMASNA